MRRESIPTATTAARRFEEVCVAIAFFLRRAITSTPAARRHRPEIPGTSHKGQPS
jgi:hypothetical protein